MRLQGCQVGLFDSKNHKFVFSQRRPRPKGLPQQTTTNCSDVLTLQFTLFTLFTLLKNGQVNFIVQLSTFFSQNTEYGLITKPISNQTMLSWYGCGPSPVLTHFFLLHHCADNANPHPGIEPWSLGLAAPHSDH